MKTRVISGLVVALAALAAGPLLAAGPAPSALKTAIAAANGRFAEALGRADAVALGSLYSEDGQALQPNSEPAVGRAAIIAMWKGAIEAGVRKVKLETVEVGGQGDTAYEVGRYEEFGAEGQSLDAGKYIVIWKRVGGQWLLHRDIWNTNLPAAG